MSLYNPSETHFRKKQISNISLKNPLSFSISENRNSLHNLINDCLVHKIKNPDFEKRRNSKSLMESDLIASVQIFNENDSKREEKIKNPKKSKNSQHNLLPTIEKIKKKGKSSRSVFCLKRSNFEDKKNAEINEIQKNKVKQPKIIISQVETNDNPSCKTPLKSNFLLVSPTKHKIDKSINSQSSSIIKHKLGSRSSQQLFNLNYNISERNEENINLLNEKIKYLKVKFDFTNDENILPNTERKSKINRDTSKEKSKSLKKKKEEIEINDRFKALKIELWKNGQKIKKVIAGLKDKQTESDYIQKNFGKVDNMEKRQKQRLIKNLEVTNNI